MHRDILLFRSLRDGHLEGAERAYERGGNVNMNFDKWMIRGNECWGLRVPLFIAGGRFYTGFSSRETWMAPDGVSVDRGDTLLMALLKCRREREITWLLTVHQLNLNIRNKAGNSAIDIAVSLGLGHLLPNEPIHQDLNITEGVYLPTDWSGDQSPLVEARAVESVAWR